MSSAFGKRRAMSRDWYAGVSASRSPAHDEGWSLDETEQVIRRVGVELLEEAEVVEEARTEDVVHVPGHQRREVPGPRAGRQIEEQPGRPAREARHARELLGHLLPWSCIQSST